MSAPVNFQKPGRALRVGVILVDSVTEVLDVAPIELFSSMNKQFIDDAPVDFIPRHIKDQALDVQFHWVSASGGLMNLTSGMKVQATHNFDNCPPLDVVLMGAHIDPNYKPTEAELAFIRKSYEDCSAFMCICAGMLPALMAGLLEGKTATAPFMMLDDLRKQAPGVKWVSKRWANDGKMWTSGVLLNGLDMMVAFAEQVWGKNSPGGGLELGQRVIQFGGWPIRDVDFKDAAV